MSQCRPETRSDQPRFSTNETENRTKISKHSCVAEQAVVDFSYDCRLAAVVVHHVAAAGDSGALGALIEQPIRRVSAQPVSKHSMTNGFWTVRTENMHIRSWRLQPQAAVLMPRRFTHGQDVTDGTQSGYVGLFVGWIGHGQVDINDILSRQAGHRGRTDMLDGQRPRAQCPPNACSEFGKTIRPLSVVGNNLDPLDRRRPVDPRIVIGVRIVMTNDVGDANHDIDATYHISRRNPSGCGRFRPAALARQDLNGLVSLDSGFRLVLRSTASRELPAEQPTSGGEVAARVQGVGRPCTAGKVHRGAVCLGLRFPAWRSSAAR